MYDYTNKERNVNNFIKLMYTKTLTMFEYTGLPDSLPAIELERLLQRDGFAVITKFKNNVTAFKAGLSGEDKDVYGRPTIAVISNPLYSDTVTLDKDSVLIKNDDEQQGIGWLFSKYGYMINETDITMVITSINKRIQTLISATDDNTVESAKQYLQDIEAGNLGVIADSKLFESLTTSPATTNNSNSAADIVELQQYLKATLFNEIGMNAPYNMKKERLTDDESQANTDNLRPLADNMLKNRQEALAKVNAMFDTDISVNFGSIWKQENDDTDSINNDENTDSGNDSGDTTSDNPDMVSMVTDIYDYITKPETKEDDEPDQEVEDSDSDSNKDDSDTSENDSDSDTSEDDDKGGDDDETKRTNNK